MTVASTTNFSLPIDELIEEAYARVGGEPVLGNEARTAKRTLDLLFTDMQNRGVLLYTIEQATQTLTASDYDYTLSASTVDVLEMVYRNTAASPDTDIAMGRIGYTDYMKLPNKSMTGSQPSQWAIDRQRAAPVLYIYPAPDATAVANGSLVYWRVRSTFDSNPLSYDPDAPRRYWPSLVSGLAYFLALKRPNFPLDRLAVLKMTYEEDLARALEEDRERVTLTIVPSLRIG